MIKNSKTIRVTTQKGTDILIETGKREIFHNDGGVFNKRCAFGNLPEGEVDFAPANANGTYIVDASFPEFGKLKSPLIFEVENGVVTKIEGKRAKELKNELDKIGKKAYVVAELGIGINPKAKITGEVLEDEKVLGTCHIAIGNNLSYGGNNDVPIHLDGVIRNPTVFVDSKKIMDRGKPLF